MSPIDLRRQRQGPVETCAGPGGDRTQCLLGGQLRRLGILFLYVFGPLVQTNVVIGAALQAQPVTLVQCQVPTALHAAFKTEPVQAAAFFPSVGFLDWGWEPVGRTGSASIGHRR